MRAGNALQTCRRRDVRSRAAGVEVLPVHLRDFDRVGGVFLVEGVVEGEGEGGGRVDG